MLRVTPAYCLNLKSVGLKRPVGVRVTLSTSTPITHPPVFDLLIVSRCALRLCFFLASRASAYLFVACGEADFFSALALVSWPALGSELTTGVVLIFSSPQILVANRKATIWLQPGLSAIRGNRPVETSVHATMVCQFSDGEPLLVRASGNPGTTADTLGLNKSFILIDDETHKLASGHMQSILPLRNEDCSIVHSHLSGALTKWPVRKRMVVISYSRLCPHL